MYGTSLLPKNTLSGRRSSGVDSNMGQLFNIHARIQYLVQTLY